MSLLRLNISDLPYHFDEFTDTLSDLKTNFRIIGITENRLTTTKTQQAELTYQAIKLSTHLQNLVKVELYSVFQKN